MTIERFKLGKAPAQTKHGVEMFGAYTKAKLPAPPPQITVPALTYPMAGNDVYGDCTIAGYLHAAQIWAATTGQPYATDKETAEVVPTYLQMSPDDQGCVETAVLDAASASGGLLGVQLDAYAPASPQSITQIHQAVAFYGCAYIGVQLPISAQEQTQGGEPWTVEGDLTIEGGHCVVIAGYDAEYLYAITWGMIQLVAYPWLDRFCEEAWVGFPQTFDTAGHGSSPAIDLAALRSDLRLV